MVREINASEETRSGYSYGFNLQFTTTLCHPIYETTGIHTSNRFPATIKSHFNHYLNKNCWYYWRRQKYLWKLAEKYKDCKKLKIHVIIRMPAWLKDWWIKSEWTTIWNGYVLLFKHFGIFTAFRSAEAVKKRPVLLLFSQFLACVLPSSIWIKR